MRAGLHLVLLLGLAAGPLVAQEAGDTEEGLANVPAPLAGAIRKYGAEYNCWAYTLHDVQYSGGRGRTRKDMLTRFDPSQPYDDQWTLLAKDGKPATEEQRKKYRRDVIKRLEERRKRPQGKSFGESLDLPAAVVNSETEESVTYEVPLLKDGSQRFPPEKFIVLMQVNKAKQVFEIIDMNLRKTWRVSALAKITAGETRMRFATISPEYLLPQVTIQEGWAEASVLALPVKIRMEMKRTDFKRVKPYADRLNVRIAPLKLLDF